MMLKLLVDENKLDGLLKKKVLVKISFTVKHILGDIHFTYL